jgi:F0F1-type ATP synthase assembly protein I
MRKNHIRYFAVALNIPLMMVVCPIVGFFLGVGAEKLWNIEPYGSYTGLGLGAAAAVLEVVRSLKRLSKMDV